MAWAWASCREHLLFSFLISLATYSNPKPKTKKRIYMINATNTTGYDEPACETTPKIVSPTLFYGSELDLSLSFFIITSWNDSIFFLFATSASDFKESILIIYEIKQERFVIC
jgi:hypothetical protein